MVFVVGYCAAGRRPGAASPRADSLGRTCQRHRAPAVPGYAAPLPVSRNVTRPYGLTRMLDQAPEVQ